MPFKPTDEQKRILEHDPRHPARLLAGPGTGKSAAVVAYLEKLLSDQPPPKVKLLTFTRAATAELAAKVAGLSASSVTHRPSTIHSFAISVLLRNPGTGGFPEPLRIADSWEDRNVVLETLKRRSGLPIKRLEKLVREMAANWESLAPAEDAAISPAERARFLGVWQEHRMIFGYTLLAELPHALLRALEAHDDLRGLDFDLLVVDEYQDLNACDLNVLRRISDHGCTIIAAGDDDQSIYSFRRAHPAGIRRFLTDYPGAADYPLSITQRCGRKIVEWANHVILGDPSRPAGRTSLAASPSTPDGEVALLSFPSQATEAKGVARLVENLVKREGVAPREILVLVPSDYQGMFSRPIREAIEALGISCSNPSVVEELLAEPPTRRLLAMCRLMANRADSIAWATVLSLEPGLNSASFIDYIYTRALPTTGRFSEALLAAYGEAFPEAPGRTGRTAKRLIAEILSWLETNALPEDPPDQGWGAWIVGLPGLEALGAKPSEEFGNFVAQVDELSEREVPLERYLGQIEPLGKDIAQASGSGVRIMKMVASKGLTVEAAILVGLEDGVLPRPDHDLGESRRLLYVAMTRAKRYLFGTWAQRRRGPTARAGRTALTPRLPSSFLDGGPVATRQGNSFLESRWPAL